MLKIVTCYFLLVISTLASAHPEVTLLAEDNIIKRSDHVFEAIFVDKETEYFHSNKPVERKEFDKLGFEKASFKVTINLLITKVIKGDLKKHQIHTIQFTDRFGSECPHLPGYGNYRIKQVYYLSIDKGEKSYGYRTVRETQNFEKLTKIAKLTGKLGVRIGRVVEVEGHRLKRENPDPFDNEEIGYQIEKLNGKTHSCIIEVFKLDTDLVEFDEKLPAVGSKFKIKGYESIVVRPFEKSDFKGIKETEEKHPQFYNLGMYEVVFIVTEILSVDK